MKKFDKNKIIFYALFLLLLGTVVFIFFNDNGILKYVQIKNEIAEIRETVDSSKSKIRSLESEIDSLHTSIFKLEKVAREKYNLKKDGERVFKIKVE